MKKIVTVIKCCHDCPESYEDWSYERRCYTGILQCDKLDGRAVDFNTIDMDCPLEDAE